MMQEAVCDLNGKSKGQTRLEYSYIMGKIDNKVVCYKISLQDKGNKKVGNIERTEYDINDQFIVGLASNGWR
jgi:hypothetical protein